MASNPALCRCIELACTLIGSNATAKPNAPFKRESAVEPGAGRQAAALMERHAADTAAAPLVDKWVRAVRERMVAEQTLELLRTHATAIAVGLS